MIAKQFEQPNEATQAQTKFSIYAVGFVTLTAALLRSINLGQWSFSTDEIFTLQNAQDLGQAAIHYRAFVEHPITSSLVLLFTQLFGVYEWSARLAPALIGTLTIPIVYFAVKKEVDASTAFLASLMLALSPWHLFWSQSARFYVLMLLFYMLGLFSFHRGMEKNSPRLILLSMFWTAVAMSERLLAVFAGPVIAVYLGLFLLFPKKRPPGVTIKNMMILFLPAVGLGIFFAFDFVRDPDLWRTLYMSWIGRGPLDVIWDFVKGIDLHVALLGVFGIYYGLRKQNRFILLLALNTVVPLTILMGASLFQFTHDRYLFVSTISSFVLAAYGAVWLVRELFKGHRLAVGVLGLLVLLFPVQDQLEYHRTLHGWRMDWRSGYDFVFSQADADALVMSNNVAVGSYYAGFELEGLNVRKTAVSRIKSANKQTWFVIGGNTLLNPSMYQWIQENSVLDHTIDPKIEIYHYSPPGS